MAVIGQSSVAFWSLEFEGEGSMKGFPGAANQAASTATQVSGLKTDFNDLLVKLKEAGIMAPDAWNITAALAPTPAEEAVAGNNALASVALEDGVITITIDLEALTESEITDPEQGTHKWIALEIGTALSSIAGAKLNGTEMTQEDETSKKVLSLPKG